MTVWLRMSHGAGRLTDGVCVQAALNYVCVHVHNSRKLCVPLSDHRSCEVGIVAIDCDSRGLVATCGVVAVCSRVLGDGTPVVRVRSYDYAQGPRQTTVSMTCALLYNHCMY
jgi:hypothetical protein